MARRLSAPNPLPLSMVLRSGAEPVRQGETSAGVWIVEFGVLLAGAVGSDGRRLADVLGPGDAVGEPDGHRSPVSVRAIRPARLRQALPDEVGSLLAARARRQLERATELAWFTTADRVHRCLEELSVRFGSEVAGGRSLGIRLTQEELAAVVGASRESANRALRTLVELDRLRKRGRGRYVVPSREAPSCSRTRLQLAQ